MSDGTALGVLWDRHGHGHSVVRRDIRGWPVILLAGGVRWSVPMSGPIADALAAVRERTEKRRAPPEPLPPLHHKSGVECPVLRRTADGMYVARMPSGSCQWVGPESIAVDGSKPWSWSADAWSTAPPAGDVAIIRASPEVEAEWHSGVGSSRLDSEPSTAVVETASDGGAKLDATGEPSADATDHDLHWGLDNALHEVAANQRRAQSCGGASFDRPAHWPSPGDAFLRAVTDGKTTEWVRHMIADVRPDESRPNTSLTIAFPKYGALCGLYVSAGSVQLRESDIGEAATVVTYCSECRAVQMRGVQSLGDAVAAVGRTFGAERCAELLAEEEAEGTPHPVDRHIERVAALAEPTVGPFDVSLAGKLARQYVEEAPPKRKRRTKAQVAADRALMQSFTPGAIDAREDAERVALMDATALAEPTPSDSAGAAFSRTAPQGAVSGEGYATHAPEVGSIPAAVPVVSEAAAKEADGAFEKGEMDDLTARVTPPRRIPSVYEMIAGYDADGRATYQLDAPTVAEAAERTAGGVWRLESEEHDDAAFAARLTEMADRAARAAAEVPESAPSTPTPGEAPSSEPRPGVGLTPTRHEGTMHPVGLEYDLPAAEYHVRRLDVYSCSGAKHLARSPAHFRAWVDGADKDTPALVFGRAAHCAILEPDVFAREYIERPDMGDGRTSAGKAAREAFAATLAGRTPIDSDDLATIRAMRASLERHPITARLLAAPGHVECTSMWLDAASGVACRARADKWVPSLGVILDLKTTEDAGDGFGRSAAQYRYHVQDAVYRAGFAACGAPVTAFVFAAVEKVAPWAVAVYVLDDEARERGRELFAAELDTLAGCLLADRWPAYSDSIQTLRLPRWALGTP